MKKPFFADLAEAERRRLLRAELILCAVGLPLLAVLLYVTLQ